MMFRGLHRRYAVALGYFWIPCPLCGQEFGGHEWRPRRGHVSDIPDGTPGGGRGICPDCTRAGRGCYETARINGLIMHDCDAARTGAERRADTA